MKVKANISATDEPFFVDADVVKITVKEIGTDDEWSLLPKDVVFVGNKTGSGLTDKENIMSLVHGEKYIVPQSDYGKAEIYFINDVYFLFSIPELGGRPAFEKAFGKNYIDEMIAMYESWT